jgi:hypothetical protein
MKDGNSKFINLYEAKAYNNAKGVNDLLISLDADIKLSVRCYFTKFCGSIDMDDICQEVRIHLWSNVFNKNKEYLNNKDAVEAYKYIVTSIKNWSMRTIGRLKHDNVPTSYKDKDSDVSVPLFVTLSLFNINYVNFKATEDIEILINKLYNNCSDIKNGKRTLDYLLRSGTEEVKPYAGFSSRTFYKAFNSLKVRVRELYE